MNLHQHARPSNMCSARGAVDGMMIYFIGDERLTWPTPTQLLRHQRAMGEGI